MAAKHHPDLVMCRNQPGVAIGRLCEKCDGHCVICDSFVKPHTLVRVCDQVSTRCCGGGVRARANERVRVHG